MDSFVVPRLRHRHTAGHRAGHRAGSAITLVNSGPESSLCWDRPPLLPEAATDLTPPGASPLSACLLKSPALERGRIPRPDHAPPSLWIRGAADLEQETRTHGKPASRPDAETVPDPRLLALFALMASTVIMVRQEASSGLASTCASWHNPALSAHAAQDALAALSAPGEVRCQPPGGRPWRAAGPSASVPAPDLGGAVTDDMARRRGNEPLLEAASPALPLPHLLATYSVPTRYLLTHGACEQRLHARVLRAPSVPDRAAPAPEHAVPRRAWLCL
jgi:hypothetical protein